MSFCDGTIGASAPISTACSGWMPNSWPAFYLPTYLGCAELVVYDEPVIVRIVSQFPLDQFMRQLLEIRDFRWLSLSRCSSPPSDQLVQPASHTAEQHGPSPAKQLCAEVVKRCFSLVRRQQRHVPGHDPKDD
jgi:hypothetical protein